MGGWRFVATEIDPLSVAAARALVEANALQRSVYVVQVRPHAQTQARAKAQAQAHAYAAQATRPVALQLPLAFKNVLVSAGARLRRRRA